jgi:hypothetical protein
MSPSQKFAKLQKKNWPMDILKALMAKSNKLALS